MGNSPTTVTTVPTAALPRAAGWQIVGYGSGRLVRIDPATGRVTVHPGTSLGTDNSPQSMISIAGRTYVGAWGSPGWMVPDTGVAAIAPGQLYDPSMVTPGPDAEHLWAATTQFPGDLRTVTLVDWSGHPSGSKIVVPPYLRDGYIYPDGAGYVIAVGIGGFYDLTPTSSRLITHGSLVAVGQRGFLVYECGDTPQCQAVLIDRASWARRVIPGLSLDDGQSPLGVISADGRRAAIMQVNYADNTTVGATATDRPDVRPHRDGADVDGPERSVRLECAVLPRRTPTRRGGGGRRGRCGGRRDRRRRPAPTAGVRAAADRAHHSFGLSSGPVRYRARDRQGEGTD